MGYEVLRWGIISFGIANLMIILLFYVCFVYHRRQKVFDFRLTFSFCLGQEKGVPGSDNGIVVRLAHRLLKFSAGIIVNHTAGFQYFVYEQLLESEDISTLRDV